MQLDISCVRSILLTVEKYENICDPVSFDENIYPYYDDYLSDCDISKILYHVQYCIKAGLLSDVCHTRAWGRTHFDCCLEPFGHDFLANTRTEEKWKRTQTLVSKVGDASLKVISSIAEGVTTALVSKYLPAEITKLVT